MKAFRRTVARIALAIPFHLPKSTTVLLGLTR
jgi:hypothetical protein